MKLNLPDYEHRWRATQGAREIFDPVRKKFVVLTPEEWVRQNFLRYLMEEKKMPQSLIRVEMTISVNGLTKRSDIVVHNKQGLPLVAVECKAPSVRITQAAFEQLARYNLSLQVPYLIVTNGLQHFFCRFSEEQQVYLFLPEMPDYLELIVGDHREE